MAPVRIARRRAPPSLWMGRIRRSHFAVELSHDGRRPCAHQDIRSQCGPACLAVQHFQVPTLRSAMVTGHPGGPGQPQPCTKLERSNSDCNTLISSAARLSSIANSDFLNYHLTGPRLLSDALGSLHYITLFNRKVLTEPRERERQLAPGQIYHRL